MQRLLVHHDILLQNSYSLDALLRNQRFPYYMNQYLDFHSSRILRIITSGSVEGIRIEKATKALLLWVLSH